MAKTTSEHPLYNRGPMIIGRAPDCDVWIDDPSVSRRHALLHVGATIAIEDLGSRNGTSVRAARPLSNDTETTTVVHERAVALRPGVVVPIDPGATLQLGSVMVMLKRRLPKRAGGARDLVMRDPQMIALHRMVDRVASTDATVLILGETGVGKELVANRIHRLSARAGRRLLELNCAALPEPLLESELFGSERGAFTGATHDRPGLLETASGGTVMLDEIGEMPLGTQAKLLRVLEEQRVMRVGAREPIPIDVRFVAATNRDPEQLVAMGAFRRDLLYRLNVVTLVVPPLRERLSEIEPLARHFLATLAGRVGRLDVPDLDAEALGMLHDHAWPGNVRELKNVMERALIVCDGPTIGARHLEALFRRYSPSSSRELQSQFGPPASTQQATVPPPVKQADSVTSPDLHAAVKELEKERILDALTQCGGNQTRAAKILGISRRMLVKRLETYGVPRPRK